MIEIGSTFRRRGADGTWATFTIRVIRYSPFPYVEAEPVGGDHALPYPCVPRKGCRPPEGRRV